jgi:hypothetical protein
MKASPPLAESRSAPTPGPWTVTYSPSQSALTVWGADNQAVAYMAKLRGTDKANANAQLIAAAPELGAALKEAKSWLFEYGIGSKTVLEQIDAALAKAGL